MLGGVCGKEVMFCSNRTEGIVKKILTVHDASFVFVAHVCCESTV